MRSPEVKSPELKVVADDHTATGDRPPAVILPPGPAQAGVVMSTGGPGDAVERAFAAAVRDSARLGDLLDALRAGRLWLPLPDDGQPVTDGSAVCLPTVRYLGRTFVPAYTSAARLMQAMAEAAPAEPAGVVPHAVVGAADLARRLPPALGIALNPTGRESVPIYPPGVAQLAAERVTVGGTRISVGPPPAWPGELLTALRAGLSTVRAVREAAAAWLTVEPEITRGAETAGEHDGEGMVISVTLDDPADARLRDAVIAAIEHAVLEIPADAMPPVDVTFPGEDEPDVIDRWVAAFAAPFYQRPAGLPAPRPASD
jgi:hypothetical protein